MARKQRLDPAIFHLPVERMREGYYSDKYFVRARDVLLKDRHRPCVTMQVFGKAHAFLGGIDEAIAILKLCSMDWDEVQVYALLDRKSTRLNSSHLVISYAVFCLKKKNCYTHIPDANEL